jgi:hypothetical protein
MRAQPPDRYPVEGDGAPAGSGLRRSDSNSAAVGDALLLDHFQALVEVEVDPAQPGRLTAT